MTSVITQDRKAGTVDLTDALRTVAVNSAYMASRALSKWFKRGVRLTAEGFVHVPIQTAAAAAGEPDETIAAVQLPLEGDLQGNVLLTFPEQVAMRLVDLMISAPEGTTQSLGELEQSCLQETGNIVASAFTNSLATWLHLNVIPGSPMVVHDLACAVIEPLIVAQAEVGDQALIARTEFQFDNQQMDWRLLLLPSASALDIMRRQCEMDQVRQKALHTIAINAAFDASRAMSKWLKRGVRLSTQGFSRIPLREVCSPEAGGNSVAALHLNLGQQLHGHALLLIPYATALQLVEILLQAPAGSIQTLDDLGQSCLCETGNIIGSSFINSWAKWLDIHSEPAVPQVLVDLQEAVLENVLLEQAQVGDEVFMAKTVFSINGKDLDWTFYLLPSPSSMRLIESSWSA